MERSTSTISDEIRLNNVKGKYDSIKAHHKAYVRRKYSKYQGMKIVQNPQLREFVETKLYDDQSPPNIAGRIASHEKHLPSISKDSIYRYIKSIYGRKVEYYRQKRKARHWRRRAKSKKLNDRTFIDKRPQFINKRKKLGDTESDFITSGKTGKGILLVVTDRKARASFLEKIVNVTISNVHQAFIRIKKRFPEMNSITTDNDLLLQKHKKLEKLLDIKIYFCHPYHSWEKGTVENTNKYIRRDIPKGSDISRYSSQFIKSLEEKLNRRSLKCLHYLTPKEALILEKDKLNKQKMFKHL